MINDPTLFDNEPAPTGLTDPRLSAPPGRDLEDVPTASEFGPEICKVAGDAAPTSGRRHLMVDRVLERLRLGPATSRELGEITHRFSARVYDLRQQYGKTIITRRAKGGAYIYELAAEE